MCPASWRHQIEAFSALLAFVRGIHCTPVDCPHKCQWREALMFSLICAWENGWTNKRYAGDLRRHRAHNDVTVMLSLRLYRFFLNTEKTGKCMLGLMLLFITDIIRQGLISFIVKCFYPNDYLHSSLLIILWYRNLAHIPMKQPWIACPKLTWIDWEQYKHNKTKHSKTVRMHYGIYWVSVPLKLKNMSRDYV